MNLYLQVGQQRRIYIIEYLNTLPEGQRTWTFSWTSRIYWKCPISQASNMSELISLIKSL